MQSVPENNILITNYNDKLYSAKSRDIKNSDSFYTSTDIKTINVQSEPRALNFNFTNNVGKK